MPTIRRSEAAFKVADSADVRGCAAAQRREASTWASWEHVAMSRSRARLLMGNVLVVALLLAAPVAGLSSVAAAATGKPSPQPHRGGCLTALKPSPPLTAAQAQSLQRAITAEVADNLLTAYDAHVCSTGGPILVTLPPGREWLAEKLTATYGTKVTITVGGTHWDGRPAKSPTCGDLAKPRHIPAGLSAKFIPSKRSVTSGTSFRGAIRVTNRGSKDITLTSGSMATYVVKQGTRRVAGATSSFKLDVLYSYVVKPGRSVSIPVIGGTTRCDGGIGSALPPGSYDVVEKFGVPDYRSRKTYQYLTPPVLIRVTTYHHPNP